MVYYKMMTEQSHSLISIIEALLFVSGEPISLQKLTELSGHTTAETSTALKQLEESLRRRGIRILQNENVITLVTAPELSPYVEFISRGTAGG
jgi:segregation and condensation protein B